MAKLFKHILVLLCTFALIGCGLENDKGIGSSDTEKERDKIPTKVEDMIAQSPGKYSGDSYDQKKVEAELDKISANASKEEVYNTVMDLLAEDFLSVKKSFEQIDTSYTNDRQGPGTDVKKPTFDRYNISILLDASGSMAGQVSGGRKMDVAKEAVETFVSTFPDEANVSLVAYGHKGSNSQKDKQLSCSEIDEIYPLGTYEKSKFSHALKSVDATGWTPLADAIKKSGETLKSNGDGNSKNIVYIVSDGLETCGGNPAKEAEALQKDGISATVNIIGFDVNNAEQQALKEVAEAGGGTFTSANSKSDLESYFEGEYSELESEWMSYETIVGGDITDRRQEKYKTLWKIRDEFLEKIKRERKNVESAMKHLGKEGDRESIEQDYINRREEIHEYLWGIYKDLDREIYNNSMDLKKKIKGDVQDKREELDKKRDEDIGNS